MRLKFTWSLVPLLAVALAAPAPAQVVINEILPNPGSDFDGAEYIEVHNTTGAPVDISGWVLGGTEFAGACAGDHLYAFPSAPATIIPANGFFVVAKDNTDGPGEVDDGFRQRFGFDADFELYDADRTYENDDPTVPNMVLLGTNDANNDTQIRMVPDNGFGAQCVNFNEAEVLLLYDGDPLAAGVLIDHLEFGDALNCTSDPCPGLGGAADGFPGLTSTGQSLGRDASGSDTDDCSADFFLSTNTPGAVNIPNAGPLLSDLLLDPAAPAAAQSVVASIVATDTDGIGTATLFYNVNGGAFTSVSMSLSQVDTYSGTIPGQLDGTIVDYYVTVTDGGAGPGSSKFPDFATRSARWGTQTIFNVQFHSPPSDTGQSGEVGNPVNIEGIVTAEQGLFNAGTVVIQSATGPWNGVHCFDPTETIQLSRGDSVRLAGTVEEFFDKTEVTFFGQQAVEVLSTGNALPGPDSTQGCGSFATLALSGEAYEGCYVRVDDVEVANDSLGFGEWSIQDGTGTCRVDDDAFYNYNPTTGDSLVSLAAIVDYSFSNRKLEPRDDADIVGPPIVATVRYSPICPRASNAITVSAQISDNGSITRAKLFYSTNGGVTVDSTDIVNTSGTNYEVAIGPYADGTVVDYHIEVTDDIGFPGRSPAAGDFDLYVGEVSIETIQGVGDASTLDGLPRNCGGIVTMAPGVLEDNIFTIQNNWTTDPARRAIQVFTGGSVVGLISEGDSVCVSGDVDEYFGLTQIDLHFTDAYINYGFVGKLPAYDLAVNGVPLPSDSIGVVDVSEPWESVLVQVSNAVITNAAVGFGQYFIDYTDPRTTQDTLVDDEARFSGLTFAPSLGDSVTVRGVVDFPFGDYAIQPRGNFDILPYDPADAVGVNPGALADLSFALHQNAPNPVDGAVTRISFAVPYATHATLRVYDVTGRLVTTLLDGKIDRGVHDLSWNGHNSEDREVSSGVYFYRLQAADKEATRKMVMLR